MTHASDGSGSARADGGGCRVHALGWGRDGQHKGVDLMFPKGPTITLTIQQARNVHHRLGLLLAVTQTEKAATVKTIAARELSDEQLATEAARIGGVIDDGFGEGSGSPGEWYYERLEEIECEQEKRKRGTKSATGDAELDALLAAAKARYEAMSPEERAEHDQAQRESWVRSMAPCEHGNVDWEQCAKCRGWSE